MLLFRWTQKGAGHVRHISMTSHTCVKQPETKQASFEWISKVLKSPDCCCCLLFSSTGLKGVDKRCCALCINVSFKSVSGQLSFFSLEIKRKLKLQLKYSYKQTKKQSCWRKQADSCGDSASSDRFKHNSSIQLSSSECTSSVTECDRFINAVTIHYSTLTDSPTNTCKPHI